VFPSTKDINRAWALGNYGICGWSNGHGDAVIELTESSALYDGFKPEEGRYILQAAARRAGAVRPKT